MTLGHPTALSGPGLQTERLDLIETPRTIRTRAFGDCRYVFVNAIARGDPTLTMVEATALLTLTTRGWALCHVLVEDEARRRGLATEIVRFYEQRLGGPLLCCWASASGVAFARRYIERFGPRPQWRLTPPPEGHR